MSGKRRQSFESGHRPKFLVVIDETEECERALYFGSRRAMRIGGGLVMLTINEPVEFQHWLGVGDVMQEEANEAAQSRLDSFAARCREIAGIQPECVIRTGLKAEEIQKLIEEDEDISFLVLAAGTSAEGPGPLVSLVAGKVSASFPIPIVIVPGALSDAEIEALA